MEKTTSANKGRKKTKSASKVASRFLKKRKEERKTLRAKVKKAKSSLKKEMFDFGAFAKLYDVSQDYGHSPITLEIKERYEEEYYLGPIDADTIQEFAEKKQELKLHDAN